MVGAESIAKIYSKSNRLTIYMKGGRFNMAGTCGLIKAGIIIFLLTLFFNPLSVRTQDKIVKEKDNSIIVYKSIPEQMFAGHTYTLFARLRNTGNTIWTPKYYRLTLINGKGNWDFKPISLRSKVNSGSDVTFSFKVTAPSKPGDYIFKMQMESGKTFFGDSFGPGIIKVTDSPVTETSNRTYVNTKNDNSEFLMQVMTNEMSAGNKYEVSVTMQNTGKTSWIKKSGYELGFLDSLLNINKNNLKYTKIELPYDVPPGKEVTFNFSVNAPDAPGIYEYQWSMMHSDNYFGEPSGKYSVKVN
jgi:hypothetical protein